MQHPLFLPDAWTPTVDSFSIIVTEQSLANNSLAKVNPMIPVPMIKTLTPLIKYNFLFCIKAIELKNFFN